MKFTGDLDDVHKSQLELIEKVLREQGFDNCDVTIEPVGKKGDNYVANVKRVIAKEDGKTFNIIAKIAPTLETVRVTMFTEVLFANEITMYTKILPKLDEVQRAAEIPETEHFKFPKCYAVSNEVPYECILLQDLKVSNYEMKDRFKSFSDEEMRKALDNLARFHGLSFVLKRKERKVFDEFAASIYNFWGLMDEIQEAVKSFEKMEGEIMHFIDDEHLRHKIHGTVGKISKLSNQFMENDKDSMYTVIQQGDSWTNNIMFKIEESTLMDCMMIDYQLSRVASPVSDLMYCIFNCTDYKTRSAHYFDWLDYYHKQLDNYLNYHNLKVNLIYPRDKLDVDLKINGRCAFGIAAILGVTMMKESDDVIDFKTQSEDEIRELYEIKDDQDLISKGVKESTILKIKQRIQELFDSFMEYGYL